METKETDLSVYLTNGVRNIMTQALQNAFGNPKELIFFNRMRVLFGKSEAKRKKVLESDGIEIPPFLICSISNTCNLACAGCYARKNGIAADNEKDGKQTLPVETWVAILNEAAALGINFALLAGGEPLVRKDLLQGIAGVKDMIFPVFTNGTLIGPTYMDFFDRHRNVIPVISLEGFEDRTDKRRGLGVYHKAVESMKLLGEKKIFFGVSVTVTSENMTFVTSDKFLRQLREWGCRLLFYVEYVPLEENTEGLALTEDEVNDMNATVDILRQNYPEIIILSFPGDEAAMGGCLASGRGFFHISTDGSAEPCPFSPYSDCNVAEIGIKAALQSPLFKKIRAAETLKWSHTGGCALYDHRNEVESMAIGK